MPGTLMVCTWPPRFSIRYSPNTKAKGNYHKYRGFQPTGWGDQPFVQGLYYDGITGDAIRGLKPVPVPQVVVAPPPPPPPVVVPQLPPTFSSGPISCPNCR